MKEVKRCTHEWQHLFIQPEAATQRIDYMLSVTIKRLDIFRFCRKCGRIGHSVQGRYIKPQRKNYSTSWLFNERNDFVNPIFQQLQSPNH